MLVRIIVNVSYSVHNSTFNYTKLAFYPRFYLTGHQFNTVKIEDSTCSRKRLQDTVGSDQPWGDREGALTITKGWSLLEMS